MKTVKFFFLFLLLFFQSACNKEAKEQQSIEDKYLGKWAIIPREKPFFKTYPTFEKVEIVKTDNGTLFLKQSGTKGNRETPLHFVKEGKYFAINTAFGEKPIPINEKNELVAGDGDYIFNYQKVK